MREVEGGGGGGGDQKGALAAGATSAIEVGGLVEQDIKGEDGSVGMDVELTLLTRLG